MSHESGLLEHIANQILVTIVVRGNKLAVYPQRGSEVVVYYRADSSQGNPVLPREVRWVVEGLRANQKIVITPKAGFEDRLPKSRYEISHPDNTACSGPPRRGARPAYSIHWRYNIELMEGERRHHMLDPDVEIRDDP